MLDQGTELAGLTDEAPGFGVENGMDYPLPQAEFDEDTHECRLDSYEIYLKQAEQYPILSPEQQTALAVRIQKGDEEAREQLVQSNLLLVVWVAQRHTNMGLPLLNLIQEGNIGLIKAVDRYRLNRGTRFSTYAQFRIRYAILRAISNKARTVRLCTGCQSDLLRLKRIEAALWCKLERMPTQQEIAKAAKMPLRRMKEITEAPNLLSSLDEPDHGLDGSDLHGGQYDRIADEQAVDPAQSAGKLIEAGIINEAIGSLNHRDQKIVRLRFGFTDRPHTLEEVGNIFGVTREAIRMLQDRALRKLRGKLQMATLNRNLDFELQACA